MPTYNQTTHNPNWKGGRTISNGKVRVLQPLHPRANPDGYVFQHILVAEQVLGRFLPPKHPVHHVDLNPLNNTNANLVICEDALYHQLLHKRLRSYLATGMVNHKHCSDCNQWKLITDFYSRTNQCKPCRNKRHQKYMEAHRATSI